MKWKADRLIAYPFMTDQVQATAEYQTYAIVEHKSVFIQQAISSICILNQMCQLQRKGFRSTMKS